jgi:hypothetical protein
MEEDGSILDEDISALFTETDSTTLLLQAEMGRLMAKENLGGTCGDMEL